MRIDITTMLGNSKINPKGIEIDELPFKRMRLRKKDNLWSVFDFSNLSSSTGAGAVYGSFFARLCRYSIAGAPLLLFPIAAAEVRWSSIGRHELQQDLDGHLALSEGL